MRRVLLCLLSLCISCSTERQQPAQPTNQKPASVAAVVTPRTAPGPVQSQPTSAPQPPKSAPATPELTYVEKTFGDATKPMPMLVALPGMGDTPENFARIFDKIEGPLRVIVVRGTMPRGAGFAWAEKGDRPALATSEEKLNALLEALPLLYPTEGKPLLTGFSQGGMLAFMIAARSPSLIQASFPIGGYLPQQFVPKEKPNDAVVIHAIHGEADGTISFSSAQQSLTTLRNLGFTVEMTSFSGLGHSISEQVRNTLYGQITRFTQPPKKPASNPPSTQSCELSKDCNAELEKLCPNKQGSANCLRPYTESGEHLLGVCQISCQ